MELRLDTPVQYIKGVGPVKAEEFARLGVHTIGDLLEYYPRDWIFLEVKTIAELKQMLEQTQSL